MELRQLRYFATVARTLSFSEAARVLNVTQSTLSQQIRQLEDELGVPLFARTSHSVSVTEAGTELLPHALGTLQQAESCVSLIRDLNNLLTGTLNIGVTYSFSPILTESLVTFMKQYPGIKLNVCYRPMAELMEMLRARTVDFVLAFKPSAPVEGVESHILFQNYLAVIVGSQHSLASRSRVSFEDLERWDLALPVPGLQARNAFDSVVPRDASLRVRVELNEVNILLKLLRQSNLVSVLAEATIHNEAGVKAIPLDVPDNEMAGCVHTLRDSYRKRSMLEFLRILSQSMAVRERQSAWL